MASRLKKNPPWLPFRPSGRAGARDVRPNRSVEAQIMDPRDFALRPPGPPPPTRAANGRANAAPSANRKAGSAGTSCWRLGSEGEKSPGNRNWLRGLGGPWAGLAAARCHRQEGKHRCGARCGSQANRIGACELRVRETRPAVMRRKWLRRMRVVVKPGDRNESSKVRVHRLTLLCAPGTATAPRCSAAPGAATFYSPHAAAPGAWEAV